MPEKLNIFLQRFFAWKSGLKQRLSERWREHVNRRTLIILIALGVFLGSSYIFLVMPPSAFPLRSLVVVPEGAGVSGIAQTLKEQHVIKSALMFRLIAVATGHEHELHAGDYLFTEPRSVFSVVRSVSLGAYGLEPSRIRIPEGAMVKTMASIYSKVLLRFDEGNFIAQALPMEGYLFPDTYFFLPNVTEDKVIRAMRQNFDTHIEEIQPLVEKSGHSLEDVVIMASMLEREARNTEDRRKIAGVLWNRLDRGMPLQVDAVFLYTLGRTTFDLTSADLTNKDDPYNTYVHKGLPPTPIGSPSMDSLRAAADPIQSDYLFYLADKEGVTHYSKTYEEHLRKKRQYLGT